MVDVKERKLQIKRLEDPFSYLSGHIPQIVHFGNKPFKLRDFIKHQKSKDDINERNLKAISWAINHLDELIEQKKTVILESDLDPGEAYDIINEIKGLLRASVLLSEMLEGEDLDPIDSDKDAHLEDIRRWIDYSKKIA